MLSFVDTAMCVNTAMFEQNGRSGYTLKPRVMWEKSHAMYNRFNPWDKEFDGIQPMTLTINVSSHLITTLYFVNF